MVTQGKVQLIKTLPYKKNLYTQGIEKISDNELIISGGRYGESTLVTYSLFENKFETRIIFSSDFFAEGLTLVEDETFWLLSFKEETAIQFSLTDFSKLQEVSYEGQGWGIAYDKQKHCLWMTNGGHLLQKRDPDNFELIKEISVEVDHIPISRMNELEYVDGFLYANIWQTNKIIKISPEQGTVLKVYDLSEIMEELHLNKKFYPDIDFLNGIAHLQQSRFLLTGKLFPLMMEVILD